MRSFLRKIGIYFSIMLAIVGIPNCVYRLKVYYGTEEAKFQVVPNSIDVLNLGSSHGVHSYFYSDYERSYSCFNMALDSQSLSYDKRVLEKYQDRLHDGSVVIIDISYFAFYGKSETEDDNFVNKNKRYYKFLPPRMIKKYDLFTDFLVRYLPLLSDDKDVIVNTVFRPIDASALKSYPDNNEVVAIDEVLESAKAASERHIGENHRDENGKLIANEEEVLALYDMVDICRQHGAIPVFITVPYLDEYKKTIESEYPDFLQSFEGKIKSISTDLKVAWYDYSSDDRFSHDYRLFLDADHMNSVGARKFTKIVMEETIFYSE